MKDMAKVLVVFVVVAFLGGCNTVGRQPQLRNAAIVPQQLTPGDTAEISVTLKDRFDVVKGIEGVVREDPEIKLRLCEEDPAKNRASSKWSLQVDVPFQAPPGEFVLDITAFRADGTPVPVKDVDGNTVPLKESLPVVIVDTETK